MPASLQEVSDTSTFPHSAVVFIRATWADGTRTFGGGAVVGINDILTALHVVYHPDNGGWARNLELYPGADYNGVTRSFEVTPFDLGSFRWEAAGQPERAYLDIDHTSSTLAESAYDVALVGVSARIGEQTGWFELAPGYDQGRYAWAAGYPGGSTGMMVASTYVTRQQLWDIYTSTASDNGVMMGAGSSGGPLYVREGSRAHLIGVRTSGSDTQNNWVDIGHLQEWIEERAAANNDLCNTAPTAGSLAAQGAGVEELFAFTLPATAFSDADGDPLTYAATRAAGGDLPAWLAFHPQVRTFVGWPGATDSGSLAVAVRAADPYGGEGVLTFTITVGRGYALLTGGDTVSGTAGNDRLAATWGRNERVRGGEGVDTLLLTGVQADWEVIWDAPRSVYLLHAPASGEVDLVEGVERLLFADGGLALDLEGAAGVTVGLIGAAFGPRYVIPALVGTGMALFDAGFTLNQVAEMALGTVLFSHLAGGTGPEVMVRTVYANVVGSAPSPEEEAYYVGLLEGGMGQADLLEFAALCDLNQSNLGLVGLQATGVPFWQAGMGGDGG